MSPRVARALPWVVGIGTSLVVGRLLPASLHIVPRLALVIGASILAVWVLERALRGRR
jgi:hypothetical protein